MLSVRISTDLRVNEQVAIQTLRTKNNRINRKIKKLMVDEYRKASPVFSGRFKKSIKVLKSEKTETNSGLKSKIEVGPTAAHSVFVIRRTAPSQGAYVPVLGKRIKFGRHPGTRANNIVKVIRPIIIEKSKIIFDQEFRGFDLGRTLK